jgi:protein-disulfide isomerase
MSDRQINSGVLWGGVVLLLILVVLGGFWAVKSDQPPQAKVYDVPAMEIEHVRGNPEGKVTLIEYGDFQCPACATYEPILQQLQGEFPSDLKFVFRHLPLRSIHRNADVAARASVAAGRQDKFWEMHDLLYARQKDWSELSDAKDTVIKYAEELGLNKEQFEGDLSSDDTKEKVEKDYQSAVDLGFSSTPTFLLNNERISPRSYDEFRELINQAINPPLP